MHRRIRHAHRALLLTLAIGLAAILPGSAAAAPPVVAGPIVNPTNGHSYYLVDRTNNWYDSEAAAGALGGHLATVNDSVKYQWIKTYITPVAGEGEPVWIGLNDVAVENNFVWVSGEA